jgi:chromosomal replication initiator protein
MDQDIWQNILDKLEQNINPQSFRTWFYDTKMVDLNDTTLTIQVTTAFTAKFLNQNYTDVLSEISYALYKKKYEVKFIPQSKGVIRDSKEVQEVRDNRVYTNTTLNERYTFEQFVVGKNNNFAYSAAYSVAESPGHSYNPLFIYGDAGSG